MTTLLCSEKDVNYSACETTYQRGVYQAIDGREIDDKMQPKEGGGIIDLVTFKKR